MAPLKPKPAASGAPARKSSRTESEAANPPAPPDATAVSESPTPSVPIPERGDWMRARNYTPFAWAKEQIPRVTNNLQAYLLKQSSSDFANPLYTHQPLEISGEDKHNMSTFKEIWRMDNCQVALAKTSRYEASGSLFWFSPPTGDAPGIDAVSWDQFHTARQNWSDEALLASSSDATYRRFEFPGIYLTSIPTLAEVSRAQSLSPPYFKDLPLQTGHALVWSWWHEVQLALEKSDRSRVLKLYEAALTVTMRVRLCDPGLAEQVVIDTLMYSETVRLKHVACAVNFCTFARHVFSLPSINTTSGSKLESSLAKTGLTYQNLPIGKAKCTALLALRPFVQSDSALASLCALRDAVPPLLHESTKLMRIAQTAQKIAGKGGDQDSIPMFISIVEALTSAVRQGVFTHEDMKDAWLIGDKSEGGYAHAVANRQRFIKWLLSDTRKHCEAGLSASEKASFGTLCGAYASPSKFDDAFLVVADEVDKVPEQTLPGSNACPAPRRDEEREAAKFDAFNDSLKSEWMSALSIFLRSLYTLAHDEEFGDLAQNATLQFSNFVLDAKTGESGIAEAYREFFDHFARKPTTIIYDPATASNKRKADGQSDDEQDSGDEASLVYAKALKRKARIHLHALRESKAEKDADLFKCYASGKLQQLFAKCKGSSPLNQKAAPLPTGTANDPKAGSDRPDQMRLILLSADVFNFSHQVQNKDLIRGSVPVTEELKLALKWMAQQREDALILACDGRSKTVRSHMMKWSEESSSVDPAKAADVWVTYSAHPGRDDPREPKRKIAFSATNREMWFFLLPTHKKHMRTNLRTLGTGAGESSTHALTYTNVPRRPFSSLPRLSFQSKEDMIGADLA